MLFLHVTKHAYRHAQYFHFIEGKILFKSEHVNMTLKAQSQGFDTTTVFKYSMDRARLFSGTGEQGGLCSFEINEYENLWK